MNIYLAGPMRGIDLYNFAEFFRAAIALRADGHIVSNPAEVDMANGLNPDEPLDSDTNRDAFNLALALREDFRIITNGETGAIVLLPNWRQSSGASAEAVVASYSGVTLWELRWTGIPSDPYSLTKLETKPVIEFPKEIEVVVPF